MTLVEIGPDWAFLHSIDRLIAELENKLRHRNLNDEETNQLDALRRQKHKLILMRSRTND